MLENGTDKPRGLRSESLVIGPRFSLQMLLIKSQHQDSIDPYHAGSGDQTAQPNCSERRTFNPLGRQRRHLLRGWPCQQEPCDHDSVHEENPFGHHASNFSGPTQKKCDQDRRPPCLTNESDRDTLKCPGRFDRLGRARLRTAKRGRLRDAQRLVPACLPQPRHR